MPRPTPIRGTRVAATRAVSTTANRTYDFPGGTLTASVTATGRTADESERALVHVLRRLAALAAELDEIGRLP